MFQKILKKISKTPFIPPYQKEKPYISEDFEKKPENQWHYRWFFGKISDTTAGFWVKSKPLFY